MRNQPLGVRTGGGLLARLRRIRLVPAGVAAALTLAAVALALVRALGGFDHNENMYVTAGWFVAKGVPLYAGIPFGQTPYLPLVYGGVFALTGTTHYLLTAKLLTWLGAVGAAALVWHIVNRRTDARAGALAAALFLANPFTLRVVEESSNYVLPITCTVGAIAVLFATPSRAPSAWRWMAAGALLGAATGLRLTYAALVLPFAIAAAMSPFGAAVTGRWPRRVGNLVGLAAGSCAALAPAFVLAARDWHASLQQMVVFHGFYRERLYQMGYDMAMVVLSPKAKLWWIRDHAIDPPVAALLILAGGAALLAFRSWRDPRNGRPIAKDAMVLGLLVGLTGVGLATAFWHSPFYPQHLAIAVAFPCIFIGLVAGSQSGRWRAVAEGAAWIAIIVWIAPAVSGEEYRRGADPSRWAATAIKGKAARLAGELARRRLPGPVATLQPLYAIEGGLEVYEELAAGPFYWCAIAGADDSTRALYRSAAPDRLDELFADRPPAAILTGFYLDDRLWRESALDAWARANAYVQVAGFDRTLRLWVRSGVVAAPR